MNELLEGVVDFVNIAVIHGQSTANTFLCCCGSRISSDFKNHLVLPFFATAKLDLLGRSGGVVKRVV